MTIDRLPLRPFLLAAWAATGFAFTLYLWLAAPGLTWAHQGADGGELLAAALTNGVPHPPSYPLYMLILQGWLAFGRWLWPVADLAWLGNGLSALFAAASVGVTVMVAVQLLPVQPDRWLWAFLAGIAWAISPLLWSQALITEVYAFHALLIALLGWAVLIKGGRVGYLAPVVACGVAHHLTFVLLLPAVLYYLWAKGGGNVQSLLRAMATLGSSVAVGLLFYLRTPLVATGGLGGPPPVNWGYADNWAGFWWLVSGAAYRGYLFAASSETALSRIAAWAYTVTRQYTPVGLAIALVGLAVWDRAQPVLRNFSILWVVPVSIYTIGYYTRDSEIYLLPVAWLMALWIALGLQECAAWVKARWGQRWATPFLVALVLGGLAVQGAVRLPALSVRNDQAARDFLRGAVNVLEPGSIVISLADAQTFALWYGAWGSGELLQAAPGTALINYSLYQFDWYRRLMRALYPDIVGGHQSMEAILAANSGVRPIYFSEALPYVAADRLTPVGPLWRYQE